MLIALSIAASANAFYIESAGAPKKIIAWNGDERITLQVEGSSLSHCSRSNFAAWAKSNLLGKAVAAFDNKVVVEAAGYWVSLDELLTRNGWTYHPAFSEAIEYAAAERRGEWQCATKSALFEILTGSKDWANILTSLALNESKRNGFPWPWTLNFAGKSYYFKTREEAHQAILSLLNAGFRNFDVGGLQINWRWHGHLFSSPWDALRPSTNTAAAMKILNDLIKKEGSLAAAIRCYHNCKDPIRGHAYLIKFNRHYNEITNLPGS
jgi:hypothetical protein